MLGARELCSTSLYAAEAIPYQLPGRLTALFREVSEGRDYVGQGRIFGYCGIGPGLREGRVVFYYHHPLHRDTSALSPALHTVRAQP